MTKFEKFITSMKMGITFLGFVTLGFVSVIGLAMGTKMLYLYLLAMLPNYAAFGISFLAGALLVITVAAIISMFEIKEK